MHSYQFFNKIKYQKFKHKYFKFFKSETYYKGDILFKEGQPINNLYFIQEGTVQLYTSKSINEIESLLTSLLKKKKTLKLNNININTNNNTGKEIYDEIIYSKINSSYDDIINYLDQKQNNKLLFLSDKEEIGLVSNFVGNE